MKFCEKCDYMYYISISEADSNLLSYYCRNCGHKDECIAEEGACVLNTQLKTSQNKFNHIINEYTKLDPTLPRIYNIPCPNLACKSHNTSPLLAEAKTGKAKEKDIEEPDPKKKSEVIYMRYDDKNLKYLYICVSCDAVWKTDDSA